MKQVIESGDMITVEEALNPTYDHIVAFKSVSGQVYTLVQVPSEDGEVWCGFHPFQTQGRVYYVSTHADESMSQAMRGVGEHGPVYTFEDVGEFLQWCLK